MKILTSNEFWAYVEQNSLILTGFLKKNLPKNQLEIALEAMNKQQPGFVRSLEAAWANARSDKETGFAIVCELCNNSDVLF